MITETSSLESKTCSTNVELLAKSERSKRLKRLQKLEKNRLKAKIFVIVSLICFSLLFVWELKDPSLRQVCKTNIEMIPTMLQIHFLTEWLLSPWFYTSFIIALIAEKFLPAESNHAKKYSAYKFVYDFMWIPPKFLFFATLWPLYMAIVQWMVHKHLASFCIQNVDSFPWLLRIIGGLLLVDFLDWCTHLIRHKVSVFWSFHSFHHSQTRINFFTEYRSHIFDDLLKWTIEAIPLILLQHSIIDVLTINRMRYWHTTIYHSNICSNYGFLKYILVTPQSHRIHHSIEEKHLDKNFGLTFSIWDHIFGTQYRNYDEYPPTGLFIEDYPVESKQIDSNKVIPNILNSFVCFLAQFFYPFIPNSFYQSSQFSQLIQDKSLSMQKED